MTTGILWVMAIGILIVILETIERKERRLHERKWHKKKETITQQEVVRKDEKNHD